MQYSREDPGGGRVATIDIETTHYKPEQGETVSIGLGVHDRDMPASEASYELFHRDGKGEDVCIQSALRHLNDLDADRLISYKGRDFDLWFLNERLYLRKASVVPLDLDTPDTHIDLFEDREAKANREGISWPGLEDCLHSYEYTPPTTIWNGREVDNTRFGEELGPAYLQAIDDGDQDRQSDLTDVIEHYLRTDLEANLALYYADIGVGFEPEYLGTTADFDVS
jgi:hypothetical protein